LPATEAVDVDRAAAQLQACVREAGALALSMFGSPINSWTKGEASPVSDADIAVDRLLHECLTAVGAGTGIAWLSEESADDPARLAARYVWIVDPIDGTRAYLAGGSDWTVSAALVEDGRPIAACLYAPVTDEFFSAIAGRGAMCNGAAISTTPGAALRDIRIAGPRGFLEKLAAAAPPFTVVPRIRSLALRLARLAQGSCDVAVAGANSHDWDLAAADLLVHEAGGALTPIGGGAVIYNRPVPRHGMLVAAGRDRHAAFVELFGDERLAAS
jgi:myo-inositol-1(or 4)-monophosphatase